MANLYDYFGFTCYCGGYGSGKTLNMVKDLKSYHEKGYFIVTNFNTTISDMILVDFDDFIGFLALIVKKTTEGKTGMEHNGIMIQGKKIVIAIDEAGIWFNNRSFGSFPKFFTAFMFLVRKFDVIPMYAVQEPDTVDANFLRMTGQYRYHFRGFFGLICKIRVFRYPLANMFFESKFRQKLLDKDFFFFFMQKELFGMYNSKEVTIPRGGIPEISQELISKFDDAFTKWKNPLIQSKIIERKTKKKKLDIIFKKLKKKFIKK